MTVLHSARLRDDSVVDVRIEDATVASVGPARSLSPAPGEQEEDLTGYLLLPAPVEPHAHLDKAYVASRVPNPAGDLMGAIDAWRAYRAACDVADLRDRARRGALACLAHGATAIRTHADAGEGIELRGIEALLAVREELSGLLPIQVVPLPSFPLSGDEGRENRAFLRAAMDMGADLVGGAPSIDPDPAGAIEFCLQTAAEFGRPVDLHMDETLDASSLWVEELARQVSAGFPQPVTASHCVSLGIQPPEVQARVAEAFAAAGISVVALPLTNLYLQGRGEKTSPPRGLTAVRALLEAGVLVAGGGDNVQDMFNPLGRGDPLEAAALLVAAGHLGLEDAYALVSAAGRAVMGLPPVKVAPGSPSELLAVRGSSLAEVLASLTEDRFVFSGDGVVARTRVDRRIAGFAAGDGTVPRPAAVSSALGGPGWR